MTTNPHTVTVTPETGLDPEDVPCGTPEVALDCAAPDDAPCHTYTDDEDGHETWHPECGVAAWFASGGEVYSGDDGRDMPGPDGVPNIARSGPIDVEWGPDYLDWRWADVTSILLGDTTGG